jgi:hypothetical protein
MTNMQIGGLSNKKLQKNTRKILVPILVSRRSQTFTLGWAKVEGFQTLREKLMICGPKISPPKLQPPF